MTILTNKKWVIGNWKMNPASVDTVFEFCRLFTTQLKNNKVWQEKTMVGIAPSFVHLGLLDYALSQECQDEPELPIMLVSQDVAYHTQAVGAFTGDVSATQISELAEWTLVGHSERRQYYGENDQVLRTKIDNAQNAGLGVIFCIGETKEQYQAGKTLAVLDEQLSILKDLAVDNLLVAYEPVWAIGTGLTPTTAEISNAHRHITNTLATLRTSATPVLYGGSVNDKNASEIANCQGVDGVLVGGASLKADAFAHIIWAFCE